MFTKCLQDVYNKISATDIPATTADKLKLPALDNQSHNSTPIDWSRASKILADGSSSF
jgi:hypothetical protein